MKMTIRTNTHLTKSRHGPGHFAAAAVAFLFLASSGLAQTTTPAAPRPGEESKTLWRQIQEGGWVMFPIALCSIATLYLIGDGIIRTSRKKTAPPKQEEALKILFRQGDYVEAHNYCKTNPSPLTNVLRIGIGLLGEGKEMAEDGMLGALAQEISQMQTYISYLSVIGVTTPMIGLLGTVTGMIKAFAKLGSSGIGDPSGLSAAIGEVLVATASGLVIAIPAFAAFYFLRNRATDSLHHIQDIVNSLFGKMPYDSLAGVQLGDDELFAATPKGLAPDVPPAGSPTNQPA
jgi:biopolymer transport protein ExbB